MFSKYDLTGREPRDEQKACLDWLQNSWDSADVFIIRAPTGAGKSFIARSIQVGAGGVIITANNALAAQYADEYRLNVVAGNSLFISQEQYRLAKDLALSGKHSVFNPISFYRLKSDASAYSPEVIILDEADQFLSLYYDVISRRFKVKGEVRSVPEALKSLRALISDAGKRMERCTIGSQAYLRWESKVKTYIELCNIVTRDESGFSVSIEADGKDKYAKFTPVKFPVDWITSMFNGAKIVLMSATMFDLDVDELLGEVSTAVYEMPSPIPVDRRKVVYRGLDKDYLKYPPIYEKLVDNLNDLLVEFKERPAIIHTTYTEAKIIQAGLKEPSMIHTKEDKPEVLKKWLENGGILLGCGMQVGLDLKDDRCRLNIILKGQYPSQADMWVIKKMYNTANGITWYENQTLRMFIQACGRSTRGASDYSTTVVCDPRLLELCTRRWESLPKYFRESLVEGFE